MRNVTDEMMRVAGDAILQHGLNAPEQVIYPAARAALEAAMAVAPKPDEALVEFAKEVIRTMVWDACDGGDVVYDIALRHGLVEQVEFDPAKHNDPTGYSEAGDWWSVFAGPLEDTNA